MIRYKTWKFKENIRQDINVVIAIPCHIRDIPLFEKYCLPSILKLDPKPSALLISFNDGLNLPHDEALRRLRLELFDKAYNELDADVVFSWGADALLRKNLVNYADKDYVVLVKWMPLRPFTIITKMIAQGCARRYWSGAYFMPRETWFNLCREQFDGNDTSIHETLGRNYKTTVIPQVIHYRLNRERYINIIKEGYKGEKYNLIRKFVKLLQVFDF